MLNKYQKYIHFVLLTVLLILLIVLYLFYNTRENLAFALNLRVARIPTFLLVGMSTSIATIVFQTITKNNILSPSIIGLDSLYGLFQTVIIFLFGSSHVLVINAQINFLVSTLLMSIGSLSLFYIFFKVYPGRIYLLLMTGLIFGTLMSNLTTFMQALIDPNEFESILSRTLVSFNTIDTSLVWITFLISVPIIIYLIFHSNTLDVLHLGDIYAKGLGVNVSREYFSLFIIVSILTAVSTALVGPVTFLGFLGANLSYRLFSTYKHTAIFFGGTLLTTILLIGSQFVVEHLLPVRTSVGVIIELVGGIYFLYLIVRERNQI
ncbi:MAG TPA: iron chelate uptake ABC transporter family permease subunit [Alloiococcus sp.]|nr:iron chelate uptake ABC transporter family permease subunit [Alloiococcus sp.]